MHAKKIIFIISVLAIPTLLLLSCRKEEQVYRYNFGKKPPPATDKDTAIAVTAKLNATDFSALGRALKPDSIISIYFFDFTSNAFLEVVLGSDTIGTYTMGRAISASTAVYYSDAMSKQNKQGFTSRATDSAGGYVKITEIDTVNHKLKGEFELLLLSRMDSSRYEFKQGSFDILYNHGEMLVNDTLLLFATDVKVLGEIDNTAPLPFMILSFSDSTVVNINIIRHQGYQGTGEYTVRGKAEEDITFTDHLTGKTYKAVSGKLNLTRYNFKEYIQGSFEGTFETDQGEQRKITEGRFVIGNTQ